MYARTCVGVGAKESRGHVVTCKCSKDAAAKRIDVQVDGLWLHLNLRVVPLKLGKLVIQQEDLLPPASTGQKNEQKGARRQARGKRTSRRVHVDESMANGR